MTWHCEDCKKELCTCYEICNNCGSKNLTLYDDGPDYPPNVCCEDCGDWNK